MEWNARTSLHQQSPASFPYADFKSHCTCVHTFVILHLALRIFFTYTSCKSRQKMTARCIHSCVCPFLHSKKVLGLTLLQFIGFQPKFKEMDSTMEKSNFKFWSERSRLCTGVKSLAHLVSYVIYRNMHISSSRCVCILDLIYFEIWYSL